MDITGITAFTAGNYLDFQTLNRNFDRVAAAINGNLDNTNFAQGAALDDDRVGILPSQMALPRAISSQSFHWRELGGSDAPQSLYRFITYEFAELYAIAWSVRMAHTGAVEATAIDMRLELYTNSPNDTRLEGGLVITVPIQDWLNSPQTSVQKSNIAFLRSHFAPFTEFEIKLDYGGGDTLQDVFGVLWWKHQHQAMTGDL